MASTSDLAPSLNAASRSDALLRSPPFEGQPVKVKGRARLLASLHRISSNPSIGRLGQSRSNRYNGTGRGSVSCMSLGSSLSLSTPSLQSSLTQELSQSYSTAPTSAVTTPGIHIPPDDEKARLRHVSAVESRTSAPLPSDLRPPTAKTALTPEIAEVDEDYFSRPIAQPFSKTRSQNVWSELPSEVKIQILSYLQPREIVRCSAVSRTWHKMCFDGQLWSVLDAAGFYQDIPADVLVKIITNSGPFVRDLNLRGCVQLRDRWTARGLTDACKNLEYFSLEGCRIERGMLHSFLYANHRLLHLNLSGLSGVHTCTMKIIASSCPRLQHLNISWCNNVEARGLKSIVKSCPNLKDLRAGEIRGWEDEELMQALFERNCLERLVLMHCDSLTDTSLAILIEGKGAEPDVLTGRPIVPPRKLKHLDLTRCRGISDQGLRCLVNNIPEIEGLQLSKCRGVLDATLVDLLPNTPLLTHLELEELDELTNHVLQSIAHAPCAKRMRHLSISYCESLGDSGMLPVLKTCTSLQSLEMDNTRISDLVLAEAAAMMRLRSRAYTQDKEAYKPAIGLRLVAYDCQNVTWTGVREILSRNAEVFVSTHTTELPPLEKPGVLSQSSSSLSSSLESSPSRPTTPRLKIVRTNSFPAEVIQLKCFYTYQPTVEEHTKRVLRGDFSAARRLERKWAEFMMAQEEAGVIGAGHRRRRRRAREAQMMHADEEDGSAAGSGVGGGRRRRARSGGCAVM